MMYPETSFLSTRAIGILGRWAVPVVWLFTGQVGVGSLRGWAWRVI